MGTDWGVSVCERPLSSEVKKAALNGAKSDVSSTPPPLTHRANFPPRFRIFNEHHSQHWPTKKANICRCRVLIVSSPAFYPYFLSYGQKWFTLPFVSKGMNWYTYHQQYCWIYSVFYRFNKGFSFKLNEVGLAPMRAHSPRYFGTA